MSKATRRWNLPVRRPWTTLLVGILVVAAALAGSTLPRWEGSILDLTRKGDPEVLRYTIARQAFGERRIATVILPDLDGSTPSDRTRLIALAATLEAEGLVAVPVPGTRPSAILVRQRNEQAEPTDHKMLVEKIHGTLLMVRPKLHYSVYLEPDLMSEASSLRSIRPGLWLWLGGAFFLLVVFLLGGGLRGMVLISITTCAAAAAALSMAWLVWGRIHPDVVVWTFPALSAAFYFPLRMVAACDLARPEIRALRVEEGLNNEVGPIGLSAGTVALCLMALSASRFQGVRWPALLSALVVLVCAVVSLTIAPALLCLWPGKWSRRPSTTWRLARWSASFCDGCGVRYKPILLLAGLALPVLALLGLRNNINHDFSGASGRSTVVPLSLVVWSPSAARVRHPEVMSSFDRIRNALPRHPGILGVLSLSDLIHLGVGPVRGSPHGPSSMDLSVRLSSPSTKTRFAELAARRPGWIELMENSESATSRLIVLARVRGSKDVRRIAGWIRGQALRLLPPDIRSHLSGYVSVQAAVGDSITKAQMVGVARFVGMLLLSVIALTVDPRLGLTASAPAALLFLTLLGVMSLLSWPISSMASIAVISSVVLAGLSGVMGLLEAARRTRTAPGSPSQATAVSFRVSFCLMVLAAAVAANTYHRLLATSILAAMGFMLAAVFCAILTPSLLAFMPAARLSGPLWEKIERRKRGRRRNLEEQKQEAMHKSTAERSKVEEGPPGSAAQ